MPLFDECCVLIPTATLEDFPSDLSDYEARSLLAAWTVLWDPRLLAQTEQLPVWYRADSPPDPIGRRLITVPASSLAQLPDHYEMRARESQECIWITGGSRDEMLADEMIGGLEVDGVKLGELPGQLSSEDRGVCAADFYAAGYASLQIQVMTRRLRYTSNLDEIHLQNRTIAAAKSFLSGDAKGAVEALHDVFDCLAEERDHYFSSDPHLIDLTLTGTSTVESLLTMVERESEPEQRRSADSNPNGADPTCLPTPSNLLIDCEVAQAIANMKDDRAAKLRSLLASGELGWAGGGPPKNTCLDAMTFAQAESVFCEAHRRTQETIGAAPQVYGRFSGATPSDLTPTLVKLGYCGMIPLDFENGSGHGEEAKVIMQSAGADLEALTAKPIDALSDASFLTLGTRLGEAIDSGEIATALLAHWPGQTCDSFQDLKRVASWSLSLGRFWKLPDYFRDGEHPYHHGTARATSPDAAHLLETLVKSESADPISSLATAFRDQVTEEQQRVLAGMTHLVTGEPVDPGKAASRFAAAVTGADDHGPKQATLLINPHAVGCRETITMTGSPPAPAKHIFAASLDDAGASATVDIPACGFVLVRAGNAGPGPTVSFGKRIRDKLFGTTRSIAQQWNLHNEFMEVTISPESGGISGVYSGGIRGNRFSMRLVACGHDGHQADGKKEIETVMRCNGLRVVSSTAAIGCIEASGEITPAAAGSTPAAAGSTPAHGTTLATYSLRYTVARGSRVIKVEGELTPQKQLRGNPWQNYFAARVAVVTPSAIYRPMLRDKLHRARSRRLVAPLGVVIDEAERHTLVSADGRAFHRSVGDRFLDTLLWVQGETTQKFTLSYGFDVPAPIAVARTFIAPPIQVPISGSTGAADIGWILHTAPKEIVISDLKVSRRDDGKLAAIIRVIQTRSQACKASIRFLHDVKGAALLNGPTLHSAAVDPLNLPLPSPADPSQPAEKKSAEAKPVENGPTQPHWLKSEGDIVSLSLPSHGVADVLVVFDDNASAAAES